MRMLMSFEIQRAFYGLRNPRGFSLLQSVIVGAVVFIMMVAPPKIAFAQFPGVGSQAPSGVATTAHVDATTSEDVSSDAAYAETSLSDTGGSDIGGEASNDGSDFSSPLNDDDGGFGDRLNDSGIPAANLKKEHHRKQLFIKRLRLEFAAIELIERKTGLPFSRGEVPRYLDELRGDLKMMASAAENGEIIEGAFKSIARDAYLIETRLNDHLDKLLEKAGHPFQKKPFFMITPGVPRPHLISSAGIDALSLKFELAEYGEKALQAMGAQTY